MQFVIDERNQRVEGGGLAPVPREEQCSGRCGSVGNGQILVFFGRDAPLRRRFPPLTQEAK
jgi:hypothetical protein